MEKYTTPEGKTYDILDPLQAYGSAWRYLKREQKWGKILLVRELEDGYFEATTTEGNLGDAITEILSIQSDDVARKWFFRNAWEDCNWYSVKGAAAGHGDEIPYNGPALELDESHVTLLAGMYDLTLLLGEDGEARVVFDHGTLDDFGSVSLEKWLGFPEGAKATEELASHFSYGVTAGEDITKSGIRRILARIWDNAPDSRAARKWLGATDFRAVAWYNGLAIDGDARRADLS